MVLVCPLTADDEMTCWVLLRFHLSDPRAASPTVSCELSRVALRMSYREEQGIGYSRHGPASISTDHKQSVDTMPPLHAVVLVSLYTPKRPLVVRFAVEVVRSALDPESHVEGALAVRAFDKYTSVVWALGEEYRTLHAAAHGNRGAVLVAFHRDPFRKMLVPPVRSLAAAQCDAVWAGCLMPLVLRNGLVSWPPVPLTKADDGRFQKRLVPDHYHNGLASGSISEELQGTDCLESQPGALGRR